MMSILADHWIDQMFPTPILTVRALSLGWISSAIKVTKIQAAYHQTSVIQMSKFRKISWLSDKLNNIEKWSMLGIPCP